MVNKKVEKVLMDSDVNFQLAKRFDENNKELDFCIFDSWNDVERFAFNLLEKFCSQDTIKKFYESNKKVNNGKKLLYADFFVDCKSSGGKIESSIPRKVVADFSVLLHDDTDKEIEMLKDHQFNSLFFSGGWGFSDEFSSCGECNKVIRFIADFPGQGEHDILELDGLPKRLCADCIKDKYSEEYFKTLINNEKKANTCLPEEFFLDKGFLLYCEGKKFCNTIRPEDVQSFPNSQIDELKKEGFEEVVFDITSSYDPFGIHWTIWVKTERQAQGNN